MKNSIVSPIRSPVRSPIIGGGDSQTAPVLLSAVWREASPSQIELTFNKNVVSADYPLGVTITIDAVPATLLTSGTLSPSNIIKIDFAETMVLGDVVLVSYNSGAGDWAGENAIPVESFTNETVTEIPTPVAPTLTLPTDAANGGTASTGTVTTDQDNGTLYFYISESATPPSAANLKDGTGATDFGNQPVIATGLQNINGDGLTSETTYYTHYLHTNDLDSNIASADGFTTADITQPTLTLPTDDANGATAYTGTVTSNEGNGTLYWYVSTSATAPSLADLKAGTGAVDSGNQAVIASGIQNVSGNTLTAETTYYIHYAQTDAELNDSNIVSADGFITEAAGGDPYWANVVLLSHFDGTNGSTTFIDESNSAHTMTPVAQAQLSTAQKEFGTASLLLDGGLDSVSIADSPDWHFADQPFTMEGWFYFLSNIGNSTLYSQWNGNANIKSFLLTLEPSGGLLRLYYSINGTDTLGPIASASFVPTLNVGYNIALERDGTGKYRIYIDGVMQGSATNADSFADVSEPFRIGAQGNTGLEFHGYVDEARITKGVARYASDSGYTLATEAFPDS